MVKLQVIFFLFYYFVNHSQSGLFHQFKEAWVEFADLALIAGREAPPSHLPADLSA